MARTTDAPAPRKAPKRAPGADKASGHKGLAPHQQLMLEGLWWLWRHAAAADCTKAQLGALIGLAVENRMFRMHFAVLRTRGLVGEHADGRPHLTGSADALIDTARVHGWRQDDIIGRWRAKLRKKEQLAMFDVLVEARGRQVPKKILADKIGVAIANRIFRMHLAVIRKLGILEDYGSYAAVSPLLFPEGLR